MTFVIFFLVLFVYWVIEPTIDSVLYSILNASALEGDAVTLTLSTIKAILGIATYYLAFRCASKWSKCKHKRAATTSASESPAPDSPPAELDPTITEPSAPAPHTPKLRFCKLCGDPIDPATRKCTGCGKQYFRPPILRKKHLINAAATIAAIVATAFVFALVSQLNAAQTQITELNAQVSELEDTVAEQDHQIAIYKRNEDAYSTKLTQITEQYDKLRAENATYREYLDYCERYCAYLPCSNGKISSNIYHRLDCPYIGTADFLRILYIDFLDENGYTPCSHCYN